MNWRPNEKPTCPPLEARTREESFQFWYRSVMMVLVTTALSGIVTVIVFLWNLGAEMSEVKVQVASINVAVAGVPEMKEKIAVLEESNADLKRRMEVYEGVRSVK